MRIIPKTRLGNLVIILILIFFIFLGLFFLFVFLGERGGATFFSNLKLTIPIMIAVISGISAFFIGSSSIIKKKERAISVFLATILGFFILLWVLAEVMFPH